MRSLSQVAICAVSALFFLLMRVTMPFELGMHNVPTKAFLFSHIYFIIIASLHKFALTPIFQFHNLIFLFSPKNSIHIRIHHETSLQNPHRNFSFHLETIITMSIILHNLLYRKIY